MKRIVLTAVLLLAGRGTSYAQRSVTADPVFMNTGNNFRLIIATPAATDPVLISSAAEFAQVSTTNTFTGGVTDLGIFTWGERYIINHCTASALALSPTDIGFAFSSRFGIVLSSAGSPASNPVGGDVNSIRIAWQGPIWGIWDSGAARCAGGSGAGGYEVWTHPNKTRR